MVAENHHILDFWLETKKYYSCHEKSKDALKLKEAYILTPLPDIVIRTSGDYYILSEKKACVVEDLFAATKKVWTIIIFLATINLLVSTSTILSDAHRKVTSGVIFWFLNIVALCTPKHFTLSFEPYKFISPRSSLILNEWRFLQASIWQEKAGFFLQSEDQSPHLIEMISGQHDERKVKLDKCNTINVWKWFTHFPAITIRVARGG
jgi:hypothetical protein